MVLKYIKKVPLQIEKKRIIDNSNKVIRGTNLFISMIDNDEFKIPKKYYAGPNNNVNLDCMNDKIRYEETAEEADSVYMKRSNGNELKLIKDFITKINNGSINNKNKAGNEFRKLKQDIESIKQEEKYDESIAESVKIRKQNTQKTFAPSSPPKKDYSKEAAGYLKYIEEQEKGQKRFSDDYDSNGSGNVVSKAKGTGLKICLIVCLYYLLKYKQEIVQ